MTSNGLLRTRRRNPASRGLVYVSSASILRVWPSRWWWSAAPRKETGLEAPWRCSPSDPPQWWLWRLEWLELAPFPRCCCCSGGLEVKKEEEERAKECLWCLVMLWWEILRQRWCCCYLDLNILWCFFVCHLSNSCPLLPFFVFSITCFIWYLFFFF